MNGYLVATLASQRTACNANVGSDIAGSVVFAQSILASPCWPQHEPRRAAQQMAEKAEEEPVYMLPIQREVMLENLDCDEH